MLSMNFSLEQMHLMSPMLHPPILPPTVAMLTHSSCGSAGLLAYSCFIFWGGDGADGADDGAMGQWGIWGKQLTAHLGIPVGRVCARTVVARARVRAAYCMMGICKQGPKGSSDAMKAVKGPWFSF